MMRTLAYYTASWTVEDCEYVTWQTVGHCMSLNAYVLPKIIMQKRRFWVSEQFSGIKIHTNRRESWPEMSRRGPEC